MSGPRPDYQIRDFGGYGWKVVDGGTGKTTDGPFTGDDAYVEACRALGRHEGSHVAEDALDAAFRRRVGR